MLWPEVVELGPGAGFVAELLFWVIRLMALGLASFLDGPFHSQLVGRQCVVVGLHLTRKLSKTPLQILRRRNRDRSGLVIVPPLSDGLVSRKSREGCSRKIVIAL